MHNKTYPRRPLSEGLSYKDLEGMLKPTIHVDEFSSKMGDDDDIIVLSFFVRDKAAARDLVNWFEKGYDWVLDADQSPGPIKPNRFLVYVELRRRNSATANVSELLSDLATLTEFEPSDWALVYKDKDTAWSPDAFASQVPLNPRDYRDQHEKDLNEWRIAAGLATKPVFERDSAMRSLQTAAGI